MQWDNDARAAVAKVPMFIRGMVVKQVEKFVSEHGGQSVTLADVNRLRTKAMGAGKGAAGAVGFAGMSVDQVEEIVRSSRPQIFCSKRTYEVKVCNLSGCPRAIFDVGSVAARIAEKIEKSGVADSVIRRANGPVLRHHMLSVSISGCLNSCSQPQIADFGIQGRARPVVTECECSGCGACESICTEKAVVVRGKRPVIDIAGCVNCGDCAGVCHSGAIDNEARAFSVLVGGKLGRRPQLARSLFEFADEKTLLAALDVCCKIFADEMRSDERMADAVSRIGISRILNSIQGLSVG